MWPIKEDWFAKAAVTQKAGPFILQAILSPHTLSSTQGISSMKEGDLPPRQLSRCFPGSCLLFSRHAHLLIKNKDSRVGTIIPTVGAGGNNIVDSPKECTAVCRDCNVTASLLY